MTTKTEPATGAGASRYALIMLTIAYAFNFIDRQILVILQEPIKADMGLSDAQLGRSKVHCAYDCVLITFGSSVHHTSQVPPN